MVKDKWPEDGSDSDPRWEGPEGDRVLEQMAERKATAPAEYRYTDLQGNEWHIYFCGTDAMPRHQGTAQPHWRVSISGRGGGGVSHGDPNLARAVAQAVEKAKGLRW